MKYTLRDAAEASGKSKSTIQRAIKNGRISAIKDEKGMYSIEPSELHRVFPAQKSKKDEALRSASKGTKWDAVQRANETQELEAKVVLLESLLEREREATLNLREDRESWKKQATALLPAPEKQQRRWWSW